MKSETKILRKIEKIIKDDWYLANGELRDSNQSTIIISGINSEGKIIESKITLNDFLRIERVTIS